MNKRNISLYKKMFVIILIIVVVIIAIFSYYLYKIDQNHLQKFDKTSNKVIQETELSDIKEKYYFQENEFYHILKEENDSQEEIYDTVNLQEEATKIDKNNINLKKINFIILLKEKVTHRNKCLLL